MMGRRLFSALALLFACFTSLLAYGERVAIAFDDLPLNGNLPAGVSEEDIARRVLEIVKTNHVPHVFGFVNGKRYEGRSAGANALRIWIHAGQRLGNHTYAHTDLNQVDSAEFIRDIEKNESVLRTFSPRADWHWLRYPYLREGNTLEKRRAIREYLRKRHYAITQVTLDYEDYLWNTPYARCVMNNDESSIRWLRDSYLQTASDYIDLDRKMAQLVFGHPIDHVLLLHLGAFSDKILPDVLKLLKEKGLTLATLTDVQASDAYHRDPDAASRFGGTLLEQLMDARTIPYPAVMKKPTKALESICQSEIYSDKRD